MWGATEEGNAVNFEGNISHFFSYDRILRVVVAEQATYSPTARTLQHASRRTDQTVVPRPWPCSRACPRSPAIRPLRHITSHQIK